MDEQGKILVFDFMPACGSVLNRIEHICKIFIASDPAINTLIYLTTSERP